ncbi:MAG TPA: hypothetical protein VFC44_08325 [Candidatus Saccharimonadales bacterium]|jgi:hypothetical protein|nr:hypothetical protein [Candidatus Saccharimonadales bacterium]
MSRYKTPAALRRALEDHLAPRVTNVTRVVGHFTADIMGGTLVTGTEHRT